MHCSVWNIFILYYLYQKYIKSILEFFLPYYTHTWVRFNLAILLLVATWTSLDPALPEAHLSKEDTKVKVGLWWRRCHFRPWSKSFSCSSLQLVKESLTFGISNYLHKLIKSLLDFHLARNLRVYIPSARTLVWKRKQCLALNPK